MNLRDEIMIDASPTTVWEFVENPESMALWNPKVKRVTAPQAPRRIGSTYAIMYEMNGKVQEFRAEFIEHDPPNKLVIRLNSASLKPDSSVEESYTLTDCDGRSRLVQTITVHNSGINPIFRLLIWFIMKFGSPTGKRYLETLKDLAETQASANK
ncbi:MAG: SRPBCC family protein [Bacteroidota bacterium]